MATAQASIADRRKANQHRQFAKTLVHYLGVEEALEVCRQKSWLDVQAAILKHSLPGKGRPGAGSA